MMVGSRRGGQVNGVVCREKRERERERERDKDKQTDRQTKTVLGRNNLLRDASTSNLNKNQYS